MPGMFSDDLPPARQMKLPPGYAEPPLPEPEPRPVAVTAGLRVEISSPDGMPNVAEVRVCDRNGVPITNVTRCDRDWFTRPGSLVLALDVLAPDPFRADR